MSANLRASRPWFVTTLKAMALCLGFAASACSRDADGPRTEAGLAKPGLWRVSDADTTIYLFGTIHMLTPGATWRSAAVDEALAGSKAAYFETDVEGHPQELQALVQRLGILPPPQRLSDKLTTEQKSAVMAAAARVGYPMNVLETQQPWFAAVSLADAAIRGAGYSTSEGVENALRREAEAGGKDVRFLESLERQLSALADLPEKIQVNYLAYSVSDIESVGPSLGRMVNAWRSGDVVSLTRLLIDDDMARLPELQDALLARRNDAWAAKLKNLLDAEPGHFFVAVGAAHLSGGDSLLVKLNQRGVASERIQ